MVRWFGLDAASLDAAKGLDTGVMVIPFYLLAGGEAGLVANGWFLFQFGREAGILLEQIGNRVQPEPNNRLSTLLFLICLVSALIWLAYEVPAIANTGQTMGKRLLGIKVVGVEKTERLGFGRALGRWFTLGLPTLLWPCGVGFVLQILDCVFVVTDRSLHQALHDRRAQTVVVYIGRTPHAAPPDGGAP